MKAIVVLMGVAGSGKTTVGRDLARRIGGEDIEGDDFHPAGNVEKMRRGEPLNDADRAGWIEALTGELRERAGAAGPVVLTCSALRRTYRDAFRAFDPEIFFVHLDGDIGLIGERLEARRGHFMPASLLQSQFETLEPLETDEANSFQVSVAPAPEAIAAEIQRELIQRGMKQGPSMPRD